ncbi:IS110 family transposase [Thermodesulfobacteriota bacterium]
MTHYSIKIFIGIDLGDLENQICILDRNGKVMEKTLIENTASRINTFFDRFESPRQVLVALETGTHSPWISQLLQARGFRVLVGNSRKLRLIWDSSKKTDERDAEMLARIARFDPQLLSPIRHRSRSAHMDLAVLKGRDTLVRCRSSLINFVRGTCKTAGTRLPKCSAETFAKTVIEHIPKDLLAACVPCINTILELTQKIRHLDGQIEALCDKGYPETMVLRQIKGVGPVTALAYVLTLEDPNRFNKSRDVGPYLGLIPKRDQSGCTDKPLSITKAGNTYLRRLLVGSAQYILGPFGPECELRSYGMRIASRGGKVAKRKATVAVARKLAVMMHHIWKNKTVYDPFYQSYLKAA